MGPMISKKDMLHGIEEMYNTEAAVLKAAAEGWSIDRLSGSTTTQVQVHDQSYIDRLSGSTTQVQVYDKGWKVGAAVGVRHSYGSFPKKKSSLQHYH